MKSKDPRKMTTREFISEVIADLKERYNRYSDGSFGGANKKRSRKRYEF